GSRHAGQSGFAQCAGGAFSGAEGSCSGEIRNDYQSAAPVLFRGQAGRPRHPRDQSVVLRRQSSIHYSSGSEEETMKTVSAGPQIIPVVICGGAGTRLWPVSRETFPKPLMALDDGQSLLQKTYDRIAALPNVVEVLTVMNRDIFFMARDVYTQGKCSRHRAAFLLEPEGRGTAAAVAAAALWAKTQYGPDALLLILPADHLIESVEAFVEAVESAGRAALNGYLATFGIVPTRPETGYGYLQVDK